MVTIIITKFHVESEGFQAYSEIKSDPVTNSLLISQCSLIRRANGQFKIVENFDTGINTANDTVAGGLIGGLFGLFTGPLGFLFFGTAGLLTGSLIDVGDAAGEACLAEKVLTDVKDDGIYMITVADEQDTLQYNFKLSKYKCETSRYDAAEVQAEIDQARQVEADLKKQARKAMRQTKADERKAKIKETKEKYKEKFEAARAKLG